MKLRKYVAYYPKCVACDKRLTPNHKCSNRVEAGRKAAMTKSEEGQEFHFPTFDEKLKFAEQFLNGDYR
jgi:hypothetical protein